LFIVAGVTVFSGAANCAEDADHFKYYDQSSYSATVTKEMNELEALYKTAVSKKVSQGEAEQARQKMVKLSRHLLRHLNERNASADIKGGDALSSTEILLNIRVMGRLLDILVADALPHEDDWSYEW
jgi:hypothetical protein